MTELDVPFPETPALAEASIVQHPRTGHECLLAMTEDGQELAFGFEVESDKPGLVTVDPRLWLTADDDAPERSDVRFEAVDQAQADDWLQAIVAHPVGDEWLKRIKHEHPDEFHRWFAQEDYDEGGEQGSGGFG